MGLLTAIWDAVKDPLMKEVNKLKEEVEETILNLKEGVELLESSKPERQKEGLQQIKVELDDFMKSEVWTLLHKSKSKTVHSFQNLLESFNGVLNDVLASFEDQDQREQLLVLLRLKMHRITNHLSKLFNARNTRYAGLSIRLIGLVIPAVAIYFLSQYVNEHNEFELRKTRLVSPMDHMGSGGNDANYSIKEEIKQAYLKEFEKAYFSYGWTPPKNDLIVFKVDMSNSSNQFPLALSTLQLQAKYEEKPFDWSKLETDAELEVKEDSAYLWLKSTKTAPIVDAHIVTSLGFDTTIHVVRDSIKIDALGSEMDWWELTADGSKIVEGPLYYKLSNDSNSRKRGVLSDCRGTYKIITTASELIDAIGGEVMTEYTVAISHHDVTGKPGSFKNTYKLHTPHLVHKYVDGLYTNDQLPFCGTVFKPISDIEPDAMILPDKALGMLGHKPVVEPNGLMLYKDSLQINLQNIKNGDTKSLIRDIDVVMNPSGYVSLLVKLKNPNNGVYHVNVLANGKTVHQFDFESFKAPEERFKYPESLKHFRKEE